MRCETILGHINSQGKYYFRYHYNKLITTLMIEFKCIFSVLTGFYNPSKVPTAIVNFFVQIPLNFFMLFLSYMGKGEKMIYTVSRHDVNRQKQIYYAVSPQGCILVFSSDISVFFCPGDRFIRLNSKFVCFESKFKMPVSTDYFGSCVFTAGKIYQRIIGRNSSSSMCVIFS